VKDRKRWNKYGFDVDVIDKYREAVRKSNRDAVKVLSVMGISAAVLLTGYGVVTKEPIRGLFFCMLLLAAGIFGLMVSHRPDSSRSRILTAGYFLSIAFYLLSIYGAVTRNTDSFWVGTVIAAGCYLLDYSLHVNGLQILSYLALVVAWQAVGTPESGSRFFFSLMYLLVAIVTSYTLNRTRIMLIMGREESREQADTDLLTGLTMRTAAQKEIEEHLKTDEHGVMMLLDLDRFKSVNDRLGHQMGDKVLVDVAADLKKMFRNSDVLSRLGGDEFVVYMKSVPEKAWAQQRASQIVREIRRWVGDGTTNVQISASVGIVMTDMVNRTYDDLYRAADIAMYCAKSEGGNKALFYTPEMLDQREAERKPEWCRADDKEAALR